LPKYTKWEIPVILKRASASVLDGAAAPVLDAPAWLAANSALTAAL